MISKIFNTVESNSSIWYNYHDDGKNVTELGLTMTGDLPVNHVQDYKLYMMIMNSCKKIELGHVLVSMMKASNAIAVDTRRGCGTQCAVSESFSDMILREVQIFGGNMSETSDPKRYTLDRYTIDVVLPFKEPVCIMAYNGPKRDVLDGGIGIWNGYGFIFNVGWEKYIRVITKSENEISKTWRMFMGDKE